MHGSQRTSLIGLAVLGGAVGVAACNGRGDASVCEGGDLTEDAAVRVCVYNPLVIETSFECPEAMPFFYDTGDVIVCSDTEDLSDVEIDALLGGEGEGGLDFPVPSDEPAPTTLDGSGFGAGAGTEASVVFVGEAGGRIGFGTAIVGDLDADGLDDVVLVDHTVRWEADASARGAAYVVYGRTELPAELSVGDADAILRGGGERVRGLGDIDGDGLADFAYASRNLLLTSASGVHLHYGSAERLSGEHRSTESGVFIPASGLEVFNVGPAGDVDGDGLDDWLITTRRESGGRVVDIATYLILGRSERLVTGFALSDADAVFRGPGGGYRIHLDAASAGDIDGDGFDDVLIGLADSAQPDATVASALFYGGVSALSGELDPTDADLVLPGPALWVTLGGLQDLDDDGYDDFALAQYSGIPLVYGAPVRSPSALVSAAVIAPQSGPTYLAGLGACDVDGDGHVDLIVGSPHADRAGSQTGAVHVLYGDGTRPTSEVVLTSDTVARYGRSFANELDTDLGYGVATGGDVNGDGYNDFLVGSPGNGSEGAGYVFLFFGGPRR